MAVLNRRKDKKEVENWENSVEWRKTFLLIYDPALVLHLGLWKIHHRHSIVPYSVNVTCGQQSVTFTFWYIAHVHDLAQSKQLMFNSELYVAPEWVIGSIGPHVAAGTFKGNTLPFLVYQVNGQAHLLMFRIQKERLNMLNNVKSWRKYC